MNHAASRIHHTAPSRRQAGFTLIELMLAMTFISVLLLAIALTIIQIGTMYSKGIVLKEMNQAARAVGDDMKRTTAASGGINLTNDLVTTSGGGRLCLGTYSYIWNTTKALEQNDVNVTTYVAPGKQAIHLVKVADSAKIYCAKSNGILTYKAVRAEDTDTAKELIPAGDHSLGVNQFSLLPAATVTDTSTGESLYTLFYTLGAGKVSAMNADQSACLGPGDPNSDIAYCTVQPFTLVLRAGNKVN